MINLKKKVDIFFSHFLFEYIDKILIYKKLIV
jgi:hypothetical protein